VSAADAEWLVAVIIVGLCAGAAVFSAVKRQSWLALPSLIPVAAGLYIRTTGYDITLPSRGWVVALSITTVALAIVSGGPLTTWVLRLTDRASDADGDTRASGSDVLRGGATIGYLERIAVVGALGLGQLGIVAAVIAIKGLGRFTELDTSEARERFIIGTLVSLLWAGLTAGLIWAPH
jgi:hypothetical protein